MVLKIPQVVCSGFNFFSHRSLDQIGLCTKNELEFQTWSLKLLGRGVGGGWGWGLWGIIPAAGNKVGGRGLPVLASPNAKDAFLFFGTSTRGVVQTTLG